MQHLAQVAHRRPDRHTMSPFPQARRFQQARGDFSAFRTLLRALCRTGEVETNNLFLSDEPNTGRIVSRGLRVRVEPAKQTSCTLPYPAQDAASRWLINGPGQWFYATHALAKIIARSDTDGDA